MTAAVTIELDTGTLAALDELAAKAAQPRDWLMRRALEDYVALQAWQVAKIEAGLAQADRGEFATEDELNRIEDELRAMP